MSTDSIKQLKRKHADGEPQVHVVLLWPQDTTTR